MVAFWMAFGAVLAEGARHGLAIALVVDRAAIKVVFPRGDVLK